MKRLKILVFEYITGGGLNKSELPESLAREGLLMLKSLIDNLSEINAVEPLIMLDYRMVGRLLPNDINIHIIKPEDNSHKEFIQLMSACDAVWPIAPESDLHLQTLCAAVERSGKLLFTSPASAVAIAGNKWLTYERLKLHSIATVQTWMLTDFSFSTGEWIIKPVDGAGCEDSFLVSDQIDFDKIIKSIDKSKYLVQPHIHGQKTSLSCLFKQGICWLICANYQEFTITNKQYHLTGITINFTSDTARYRCLICDIAKAMPDLWGYVGIDLIETEDRLLVLEINPRLTTSFAGIHAACGINCAHAVMDLLTGDPQLQASRNQPVYIKINGTENNAG